MKYLITGGGTGGHIYPALAIAEEIKKQDKEAEILYVGTKKGLEAKVVPKAGYNFKTIRVKWLPRKINLEFFKSIKESFLGILDSNKIIKEFEPDVVIGTGGYVAGPVVLMASIKGIPTLIHEQNAYPGITNKLLSRVVDKTLITFKEAESYFKKGKEIVLTGNPVRQSLFEVDKNSALKEFNVKENEFVILSFGGSGGQKVLNDIVMENLDYFNENRKLIHVTGERFFEEISSKYKEVIDDYNVEIVPYLYNMPEALSISDLVITSAGAITLAEISALGLPSILIPKGYSAENHQEFNANFFEKEGASVMLKEKDATSTKLREIIETITEGNKLDKMAINSKKIGKPEASEEIYKEIVEVFR